MVNCKEINYFELVVSYLQNIKSSLADKKDVVPDSNAATAVRKRQCKLSVVACNLPCLDATAKNSP